MMVFMSKANFTEISTMIRYHFRDCLCLKIIIFKHVKVCFAIHRQNLNYKLRFSMTKVHVITIYLLLKSTNSFAAFSSSCFDSKYKPTKGTNQNIIQCPYYVVRFVVHTIFSTFNSEHDYSMTYLLLLRWKTSQEFLLGYRKICSQITLGFGNGI